MRLVRWMAGIMVLSVAVAIVAVAAAPLDSTLWRVEITEDGSTIPQHVDRITFQDGKFTSAIYARKSFVPTAYTHTVKPDGPVVWDVEQKNDTAGELIWHGERKGDAMTGTLTWKQPDGKITKYALVGAPVVEEAAPAAAGAKSGGWNWGCSKK